MENQIIKALVMDVDGTLMDFGVAEHKAFLETMSEFGLPATQEVEETYQKAEEAQTAAQAAKEEYTSRLSQAKEEAQALIKEASVKAQGRAKKAPRGGVPL